jgi:hypothetical protein
MTMLRQGKMETGATRNLSYHANWKEELQNIPSMASLGVLKPRPTLFQNLLPALPGL